MFHATTARTPAKAAKGMNPAKGAATSIKASTKSACSIPDTGPRDPARTLVAVRAMVPVTQNPPNKGVTTLATPCAISSALGRCRRPDIPSATTADNRLSIAPRSVNDSAQGSAACTASSPKSGKAGAGGLRGKSPKRL